LERGNSLQVISVGEGSGSRCSSRPLVGNSWFLRHPSDFAGRLRHVVVPPVAAKVCSWLTPLTETERRRACVCRQVRRRGAGEICADARTPRGRLPGVEAGASSSSRPAGSYRRWCRCPGTRCTPAATGSPRRGTPWCRAHEDRCPNERGRGRARRTGDSACRRQGRGRSGPTSYAEPTREAHQ
jgi:hypothetical protein